MKFSDIPQFPRCSYSCSVSWRYLERWLAAQAEDCIKFDLDPDFQRHHVWDDRKRSRYVEYVLRGGKSSRDLYFNCAGYMHGTNHGPMELVDGKQRLEAVRRYLRSEVPAFGHLYCEMEDKLNWVHADFIVHVNHLETRKEVLQWYLDLNDGGVVHTDAELEKVRKMIELA